MAVKAERGYLIWAIGDEYVECAMACAKSIRLHTPRADIALLSDKDYPNDVFDYNLLFPMPVDYNNVLANDWQVFYASPFRQTIKVEADMIIPHSIEHWWTMLEHKDVVLTTGARNAKNEISTNRFYRKIFDANNLPDVYNAITYWRLSPEAHQFFTTVQMLFDNWGQVQSQIKMGLSDPGTTDLVYALAALMVGVENVTLPGTSYPTLIHMKGKLNKLMEEDWTKEMVWELDKSNIRINTIDQQYPFHYYIKEFSKELNKHYDELL